jgi:hypothetical protein
MPSPIIHINPLPTSQKTRCISIALFNSLILFRDIIFVYSENNTGLINMLCRQNADIVNVRACGTYNNHSALKHLLIWDSFPKIYFNAISKHHPQVTLVTHITRSQL